MSQAPPSPVWLELLKLLPSIVTAIAAVVGVGITIRGLDRWRRELVGKRKAELAEEVLADFYRARDLVAAARSPMAYSSEGASREKRDDETDDEAGMLDAYYAVIERLNRSADFFSQMEARRYRFMALFGEQSATHYAKLFAARGSVIVSAGMLMRTHRRWRDASRPRPDWEKQQERWESDIGWGLTDTDTISAEIAGAVTDIEKLCRPAIEDSVAKSRWKWRDLWKRS